MTVDFVTPYRLRVVASEIRRERTFVVLANDPIPFGQVRFLARNAEALRIAARQLELGEITELYATSVLQNITAAFDTYLSTITLGRNAR